MAQADLMAMARRRHMNSMLYWWPRVEPLRGEVPMPETVVVECGSAALLEILDGSLPAALRDRLYAAAEAVGYPLFMRTDHASGKHEWRRTCYVEDRSQLVQNLYNLIEWHECAGVLGVPYAAVVFRRYIPLTSAFRAFRGMPVAKERRYFVLDGRVLCCHPYWPEEAIEQSALFRSYVGLPERWRDLLAELNREEPGEAALLAGYAEKIGRRLPGYWSVDFARGADGRWYFLDAALGEMSWHPECEAVLKEAECP